ncbi:MAG: hypothetical protein ACO3HC_02995 [Flavobacteriaceae bacterium]
MKLIFHLVSRLFHPIVVPFYGTVLYLHYSLESIEAHLELLSLVVGVTFLIPLMLFYLLRSKGKVSSSNLPHIAERWIPLFLNTFLLSVLALVINLHPYLELRDWIILLAVQNLFTLVLLRIPFKTSIHLFNSISLLLFLGMLPLGISSALSLLLAIVWVSLICAARLVLKAHRPIELLVGGILAISVHAGYFWWVG